MENCTSIVGTSAKTDPNAEATSSISTATGSPLSLSSISMTHSKEAHNDEHSPTKGFDYLQEQFRQHYDTFAARVSADQRAPLATFAKTEFSDQEKYFFQVDALEAAQSDLRSELASQKLMLDELLWDQQRTQRTQRTSSPARSPRRAWDTAELSGTMSAVPCSTTAAEFEGATVAQTAAFSAALEELRHLGTKQDIRLDRLERNLEAHDQICKRNVVELQEVRRQIPEPAVGSGRSIHGTVRPVPVSKVADDKWIHGMIEELKASIREEKVVREAELSNLFSTLSINSPLSHLSLEAARSAFRTELQDELSRKVDPLTQQLQRLFTVEQETQRCSKALGQVDEVLNYSLACMDEMLKKSVSDGTARKASEDRVQALVSRLERGSGCNAGAVIHERGVSRSCSRGWDTCQDFSSGFPDGFEASLVSLGDTVRSTLHHSGCNTPDVPRGALVGSAPQNLMSEELKQCLESLGQKVDMTLKQQRNAVWLRKAASPTRRPLSVARTPSPGKGSLGGLRSSLKKLEAAEAAMPGLRNGRYQRSLQSSVAPSRSTSPRRGVSFA